MRLAVNLGYWGSDDAYNRDNLALAREADRLGYAAVWVAEAYGSDAATVLAWIAAQTEHIDLGSAVFQIPARTPAMTAMTAATLDTLSGGRFRLGLGVSGPQVSEGWHGVRFDRPLARTREYVEIVRTALRRDPVVYDGKHFTLPLPDGPGRALRLAMHPRRAEIPIYLAAIGPKNLELAGAIADGWLAIFFTPEFAEEHLAHVRAGRAAAGKELAGFDVAPTVPLVVGDDLATCVEPVRGWAALYIGGMGSREHNFYNQLAGRMGFAAAAARVQERYLARDYAGAAAAVPEELVEQTALLGSVERLADRMRAFAAAGVTTLTVSPMAGALEDRIAALNAAVEAHGHAGLADHAGHAGHARQADQAGQGR
jgi:F420-dependent oxidoreductase-like protein